MATPSHPIEELADALNRVNATMTRLEASNVKVLEMMAVYIAQLDRLYMKIIEEKSKKPWWQR